MKIDILDKAAETGIRYSETGVNPTFGEAYFYSKEAGNRFINFGDVIWDYDIDPIIENCRRFDITDFTISSTFSSLLKTLAEFEKRGCHLVRLIEIYSRYEDWRNPGNKEVIPAILMRLDKE